MSGAAQSDAFEIQQFVQRTAALLNAEELAQWLEQFELDGTYEITVYSTELGKDLAWWKQDLTQLRKTISEVPRHVRDPARRLHVLGPPLVNLAGDEARVQTAFSVFRTLPTGQTSLFAVGRYHDELVRVGGAWRFRVHRVQLETRVLDAFTHLPL